MKDKPSFPPRMEGWEYQYERAEKLEKQNAARLDALEKLVLAFDVGDIAHTTLNGRGYPALAKTRQVIAEGKKTTKNKE